MSNEPSNMISELELNLGEQPIARLMQEHNLKAHDLVAASTEHITHKMVSRACKGRRLTPRIKTKILNAVNKATTGNYAMSSLFTY